MSEKEKASEVIAIEEPRKPRNPMVFISHDTRDADIAEAFSKLLGSVSAGVLKSFRTSDKKSNQGIEYGIEWYPEIMRRLAAASDVVCLLTPNSMNRPWILYEAGVAKGKLETPVHGVALGIPLASASTGPFAQFQNCDDAEDSLTSLVIQLVSRIPNAEPDKDIVKMQVIAFKNKVSELLSSSETPSEPEATSDETAVAIAKMFEEIKVMYSDLPSRIERKLDPSRAAEIRRRRRGISPMFIEQVAEIGSDPIGLLIILSQFKDDYPWLYEIGSELYKKIKANDPESSMEANRFMRITDMLLHHPISREFALLSKNHRDDMEESLMYLRHLLSRWI